MVIMITSEFPVPSRPNRRRNRRLIRSISLHLLQKINLILWRYFYWISLKWNSLLELLVSMLRIHFELCVRERNQRKKSFLCVNKQSVNATTHQTMSNDEKEFLQHAMRIGARENTNWIWEPTRSFQNSKHLHKPSFILVTVTCFVYVGRWTSYRNCDVPSCASDCDVRVGSGSGWLESTCQPRGLFPWCISDWEGWITQHHLTGVCLTKTSECFYEWSPNTC